MHLITGMNTYHNRKTIPAYIKASYIWLKIFRYLMQIL